MRLHCWIGLLLLLPLVGRSAQAANVCALSEGGIGGTGIIGHEGGLGGTGIVGVITGFGSICVAGVEVHYNANTPIRFDARPLVASALKIGHVVQAQARGLGDSVHAISIELTPLVTGHVTKLDPVANRIEVLGQSVRVSSALMAQAQQAKIADHPVMVSGMRIAAGDIVATRVDTSPGLTRFGVTGALSALSRDAARIGDLQIKLDREQSRQLQGGQVVEIRGVPENGVFRASTVSQKGLGFFKGQAERVVLGGFLSEIRCDHVRIDNTQIQLSSDARAALERAGALKVDQRVVVSMRSTNGKFVVERAQPVRSRDTHGAPGSDHQSDGSSHDTSNKSRDSNSGNSGSNNSGGGSTGGGKGRQSDSQRSGGGSSNRGSSAGSSRSGSSSSGSSSHGRQE